MILRIKSFKEKIMGILVASLLATGICGCGEKPINGIESPSYNSASSDNPSTSINELGELNINEFSDAENKAYSYLIDEFTGNEEYYDSLVARQTPFGMAGEVVSGYSRDIFFANGTPVTIVGAQANVSEYNHDLELQAALGNGLSDDNRGFGAIILWEEDGEINYVYVSNMAEVFGGALNSNLNSDTFIFMDGSVKSSQAANVSYIFGGSLNGDVVGNITISVNSAQPMYVYGGCLNGNVYGDTTINYSGNCWSYDILGGGLSYADAESEAAFSFGDVYMNINCNNNKDMNFLAGGGACSVSNNVAVTQIVGTVSINCAKFALKQLSYDGGISSGESAYSFSDVSGNIICNETLVEDTIWSSSVNMIPFDESEVLTPTIYDITTLNPVGLLPEWKVAQYGEYEIFLCNYTDRDSSMLNVYLHNISTGEMKYRMLDVDIEWQLDLRNMYSTNVAISNYIYSLYSMDYELYESYKGSHYNPNPSLTLIWYGQSL